PHARPLAACFAAPVRPRLPAPPRAPHDAAPAAAYPLSLHDALPICRTRHPPGPPRAPKPLAGASPPASPQTSKRLLISSRILFLPTRPSVSSITDTTSSTASRRTCASSTAAASSTAPPPSGSYSSAGTPAAAALMLRRLNIARGTCLASASATRLRRSSSVIAAPRELVCRTQPVERGIGGVRVLEPAWCLFHHAQC